MSRSSAFNLGLALFYGLAYFNGYSAGQKSVVIPAPPVCPQPKTDPERCMAFWFGTDDKAALRQRVCGKDSNAASRR